MYKTTVINAETLGEAWELACRTILEKGHERYVQAPEYQILTRDLPLMINVSEPFREPRLSRKAKMSEEQARIYAHNFIHGTPKEKENSFDYTYYSRLRCYPDCKVRAFLPSVTDSDEEVLSEVNRISDGKCCVQRIDQVEKCIRIFEKDKTRRTVVMHTWIPYRDLMKFGPKRENTSSPCLVLVHPQIVDDRLHMFVTMKTNDLFNAWPGNAYAFTELQKYIAEKVGVGPGSYTHFSISMHIYQDAFEEAEKLFM